MRSLSRRMRTAQLRWPSSLILALVLLLAPAAGAASTASAAQPAASQHFTASYGPGSECSGTSLPC